MKYKRSKVRELIEALTQPELYKSLDDFPKVREQFTDGQPKYFKVEIILDYFDKHPEEINKLLEVIKKVNLTAYEKYDSSPDYRFPEACQFDLNDLMDECLPELYGKQGLVGLIISCEEESFRVKFCERLEKQFGRRKIIRREPLQLNPNTTLDYAVNKIKRYKNDLLQNKDVICPIPVSVFDPTSPLPDQFWQALSEEFKHTQLQSCLILFMYGSENACFPKGLVRLTPPQFTKRHALRWITDITNQLDWEASVGNEWHQLMLTNCCCNDHSDLLDIRFVYEHLDSALMLLQQDISAKQFLDALRS